MAKTEKELDLGRHDRENCPCVICVILDALYQSFFTLERL